MRKGAIMYISERQRRGVVHKGWIGESLWQVETDILVCGIRLGALYTKCITVTRFSFECAVFTVK